MNDAKRKNDYEKSANEFLRWERSGDDLYIYISSRILEKHYRAAMEMTKQGTSGILPIDGQILSQVIYLKSESLELYLKALFVKQGHTSTENGKLTSDLNNHNLLRLCSLTNILLDKNQKILLDKLLSSIKHWGRYPVPKHFSQWRPTMKGIVGIQTIYMWSDKDNDDLENLLIVVKDSLRSE